MRRVYAQVHNPLCRFPITNDPPATIHSTPHLTSTLFVCIATQFGWFLGDIAAGNFPKGTEERKTMPDILKKFEELVAEEKDLRAKGKLK